MSDEGKLSKKTIMEIEEMLRREKSLLKNTRFLQRLPDKGALLIQKVEQIEKELAFRIEALKKSTELEKMRSEVDKLEWNVRALSSSSSVKMVTDVITEPLNENNLELDSDDDEQSLTEDKISDSELEIKDEEERIIKMLATSQISQNQSKHVVIDSKLFKLESRPLYVTKLAEVIDHKSRKSRFVLNKSPQKLNTTIVDTPSSSSDTSFCSFPSSPALSSSTSKDDFESCVSTSFGSSKLVKKKTHWDESLAPPQNLNKSMEFLTLEESFDLSKAQQQKERILITTGPSAAVSVKKEVKSLL